MLSSAYRIRLTEICDRIANQEEVSLKILYGPKNLEEQTEVLDQY
jgi:hypothetical protein